jgi:hypothetical protein
MLVVAIGRHELDAILQGGGHPVIEEIDGTREAPPTGARAIGDLLAIT